KARFLRDCFTTIPLLRQFEKEAINILDRSARLADLRHDLIHSVLVDMSADNGKFKFRITRIKGDEQLVEEWLFNAIRFPKIERDYSDLVSDSAEMSARLLDHFRPR